MPTLETPIMQFELLQSKAKGVALSLLELNIAGAY